MKDLDTNPIEHLNGILKKKIGNKKDNRKEEQRNKKNELHKLGRKEKNRRPNATY
jgi:hypothetical protein